MRISKKNNLRYNKNKLDFLRAEAESYLMDIGRILRQRRERRNETLEAVAKRAGVNASSLSRIERGRNGATIGSLVRICEALEVSVIELFEEAEGRPRHCHLSDPASAFDADTRELISAVEDMTPKDRKLLLVIAEAIRAR